MTIINQSIISFVVAAMIVPVATTGGAQSATDVCGQTYTVKSGDSLSLITSRVLGTTDFEALYEANRETIGANPNLIKVGQVLTFPCAETPTTVAQASVTGAQDAAVEAPVAEAASGPLVFTFNRTSNPPFIVNKGIIDPYLAEIAEVTEGRVTFVNAEDVSKDPAVQYDLVTSSDVDGAYVFNATMADEHPLLQLPMLPLMGGSAEQTAASLWHLHAEYLEQTDYFDEAALLGFIAAPSAHIWRRNEAPVVAGQNIADTNLYAIPYFEGLDTRGPPQVQAETADRLEMFDEDKNGTLTFFMAHGAARAAGIWANDRTVTEVDYGMYTPTFSILLSNAAWDQITPADQEAIRSVSGSRLAARSASWDFFDHGHRQHMIETGLNIEKASDAVLAELASVTDAELSAWKAAAQDLGVDADAALAAYKAKQDALADRLIFR